MRSSNISSRFDVVLLGALVVGCSSSPSTNDAGADAATGCVVDFSGNLADEAKRSECATVSTAADAGGYTLTIDTSSSQIARIQASIALGTTPTPGQITNESVTDWTAIALQNASACFYQAGATSVPAGSFTLDLTSFDASTQTAHGTLTIVAYVHAPPTTDCSYGDLENITIHF